MYEFHWLDVPFCPGTSWATVKLKSAAGRPCKSAPFSSVSWNFTTGGPLIVTLVIVPVIAVAVLTLSADPELGGPGGPVAPVVPAGPAEPVVPLQAARSAHSSPAPNAAAPGRGRFNSRVPFARDIQNSPYDNPDNRSGRIQQPSHSTAHGFGPSPLVETLTRCPLRRLFGSAQRSDVRGE
jgi:hypothetical protein